MKGYKIYKNKFHDKDEWELLKEQNYSDGTISLFRSNFALRLWVVTKTFPNGDALTKETDNEVEAWQTYHGMCVAAAENDSSMWA